jgi:cobalamin biosynthesis protein CobT
MGHFERLQSKWERIARVFSRNFGVRVQLSGLRACTDGATISLPANADHFRPEDQQVLEGLLDHELSHVKEETEAKERGRQGPLAVMKSLPDSRTKMMFNCFEDIRIEERAARDFPGMAENLRHMNEYLSARGGKMRAEGKLKGSDFWTSLGCYIIAKARGFEDPGTPKSVKMLADGVVGDLIVRSRTAATPQEAAALARECVARMLAVLKSLKDEAKRREEEPEAEDEGGAPEMSIMVDGDEGEEREDGEKPEVVADLREDPEVDDSKEADDDKNGSESDSAGDESADGDDSADADDDDGEAGEADGSGGEDDDEAAEDDAEDVTSGEDGDEDGDEDEDSTAGKPGASGDESSDPVKDLSDEGLEEATKDFSGAERDATTDDLIKEVKEELGVKAEDDAKRYHRWIPNPDAVARDRWYKPETNSSHTATYMTLKASVSSHVAGLKQRILAAIRASTLAHYRGDQEVGDLDTSALYGLRTGNKRIFRQTVPGQKVDTAVEILVDESGSMGGKMRRAIEVVIALGETLSAINIPFEVVGWTNVGSSSYGEGYTRFMPFAFRVVKEFAESWATVCHRAVTLSAQSENVDGEAVWQVAQRIAVRKEARKIIFVLSDGEPCGGGHYLNEHLNEVVKRLTRAGIEVYGIGIQTTAVRKFYNAANGSDHIVVNDLNTLAADVFRLLRRKMLQGRAA